MPKQQKPTFDKVQLEAGVKKMLALRQATEGLPHLSLGEPAVFNINYDGPDPIPVNDKAKKMVKAWKRDALSNVRPKGRSKGRSK